MHKQSLFKISNFILIAFYSSAAVQCTVYQFIYNGVNKHTNAVAIAFVCLVDMDMDMYVLMVQ